jgi:hypothetical protein
MIKEKNTKETKNHGDLDTRQGNTIRNKPRTNVM